MRQDALRRLTAFLACASTLALPGVAGAAVVWTANFESGTLAPEWMNGVNGTKGTRKNVEVLGEQVYGGKFAGKITIHPDDTFTFGQNRVDIQHQSTLTAQNEQIWLSGHYMMPEDAKVRNEFAFFESNSSFLNAMDFWVEPKMGGGTNIVFGVGDLGGRAPYAWTGNFTIGVWHQVAIHVLWSTSATVGTVDVWFDGVQVVTNLKAQTSRDTNTLFFQTGMHRRAVGNFTEVIYLDDFIEADNFADAKIAPPIGAGDAGAGDASSTGAGGAGGGGRDGGATDAGSGSGAGGATGGAAGAGAGGSTGAGTGGTTDVGTGAGGATGAGTTGTAGATSGTGTAGAATTGPATTGTTGGATGSASTGTSSGAPADASAGCSCSVLAAERETPKWWAGTLLLAGAMAARRRRRS